MNMIMSRFPLLLGLLALLASLPAQAALPAAVDGKELPSLAPVLERVTPSVVNVYTQTRVRVRSPLLDDPFFRRFFNVPDRARERVSQSLGSGVIVDADKGYVLDPARAQFSVDYLYATGLRDGASPGQASNISHIPSATVNRQVDQASVDSAIALRSGDVIYGRVVGLDDKVDDRVGSLSGGQRRRVDLALGIVVADDQTERRPVSGSRVLQHLQVPVRVPGGENGLFPNILIDPHGFTGLVVDKIELGQLADHRVAVIVVELGLDAAADHLMGRDAVSLLHPGTHEVYATTGNDKGRKPIIPEVIQ